MDLRRSLKCNPILVSFDPSIGQICNSVISHKVLYQTLENQATVSRVAVPLPTRWAVEVTREGRYYLPKAFQRTDARTRPVLNALEENTVELTPQQQREGERERERESFRVHPPLVVTPKPQALNTGWSGTTSCAHFV